MLIWMTYSRSVFYHLRFDLDQDEQSFVRVRWVRAACALRAAFTTVERFGAEVGLREVRVSLSRMWCVYLTMCYCVWSASCHVGTLRATGWISSKGWREVCV